MDERGGRTGGRRPLLGGTLLLMALALVAAALVDRDPRGRVRPSPLPFALTLLDPATWTALAHGVAVAGTATALALLLGVPLAGLLPRARSPLRAAILPLVLLPGVLPVPVHVLGLSRLLPPEDRLAFVAPWAPGWGLAPFPIAGAWPLLVWIDLLIALPLVVVATLRARDRLDPALADAARAAGASRRRVVLGIVWPLVRPSALGAAALAFGLALFEPAAPLLLGARRTLAFAILEGATGDDLPRAATLTLLGLAVVAAVHTLLRLRAPLRALPAAPAGAIRRRPGWTRVLAGTVATLLWLGLAWAPALRLASDVVPGWMERGSPGRLAIDPALARVGGCSLAIGLAVAALTLALARPRARGGLVGLLRRLPPLALAVAGLAVPSALRLAGDALPPGFAPIGALAGALDPYRASGVLLVVVLVLAHLPLAHRAARRALARTEPAHVEMAWTLGAGASRARRDVVLPLVLPDLLRAAVLVGALAAADSAAALLLVPLPGSYPVGPALVAAALGPDPAGAARLAVLAAIGVALPFALASGARLWGPDAGPEDASNG
jgi:ABC-type Fe3+ transport system permease subunit